MHIEKVHHIAIICSDFQVSKKFYTEILGMKVLREVYRGSRNSYKLDLALNDEYIIELFSFPDPSQRVTRPEACGLRHLAFEVADIDQARDELLSKNIEVEPVRIDENTHKKFVFFFDPDNLPIEFCER